MIERRGGTGRKANVECWIDRRVRPPPPPPILEGKTASSWDTARITRGCCVSTMIIVDYGLARKLNTHRAARSCTFRRWNAWSDGTISLGPSYSINDRATRVHVIPCGFTFGNVAHCVWRTRCTSCLLALRASPLPFLPLVANWKKKKTPISTLPFPDFPILFFFPPLFWGGKNLEIWKKFTYENLGICSSHCNRFNGWSIKWIVNFGIKVHYESIAEGSSRAISVFLCPFAWIFLVTLFIITWIYFRR